MIENNKQLELQHILQGEKYACWAACMEMVIKYYNNQTEITQKDLMQQYLNIMGIDTYQSLCLEAFTPSAEIYPSYIPYLQILFLNNGYYCTEHDKKISWEEYKYHINNGNPLILFLSNYLGQRHISHTVVAIGYAQVEGKRYIKIHDPLNPNYCNKEFPQKANLVFLDFDEITTLKSNNFLLGVVQNFFQIGDLTFHQGKKTLSIPQDELEKISDYIENQVIAQQLQLHAVLVG